MVLLQLNRRNEKKERTHSMSLYDLPEEYLRLEYPEEWESLKKTNIKDKMLLIIN